MDWQKNDFFLRLSQGRVPRHSLATMTGRNPDVDSTGTRAVPVDIWPAPGDVREYPFLAAASSLEMVSTSANDSIAGTGARVAAVIGLDPNWDPYPDPELVVLAGTTPVALTRQYIRINQLVVLQADSAQRNQGDITLRTPGGASVLGFVPIGYGISQCGVYSVPRNHEATLLVASGAVHRASGAVEINFEYRSVDVGGLPGAWIFSGSVSPSATGSTVVTLVLPASVPIGPKTDIKFRAVETTANNIVVSAFAIFDLHRLTGP